MGRYFLCGGALLLSACASAPAPVAMKRVPRPEPVRPAVAPANDILQIARDNPASHDPGLGTFDAWWGSPMALRPREAEIVSAKRTASGTAGAVHLEVIARNPGDRFGTLYLYERRGRAFQIAAEVDFDLERSLISARPTEVPPKVVEPSPEPEVIVEAAPAKAPEEKPAVKAPPKASVDRKSIKARMGPEE